jgi:long-chain fatty acid transport protein
MGSIRNALACAISIAIAIPSTASATNGIYLIGYGSKSRAMGGVGIGYAQDAIGFHQNPAAINDVKVSTMRVDADIQYFKPIRSATMPDNRPPPNAGNPVEYRSGSNQYLIPALAGMYKFNRSLTIGFSFVGAGGGGTRYTRLAPNGFNFFNPVGRTDVTDTLGVNYFNAQMSIGAAYKISRKQSLGFAVVGSFSRFNAYGLGVFKPFSEDQENLSNRGNDYNIGGGLKAGWKWNPTKWLGIGLAGQTKLVHTAFDKYAGLFPDQGQMDLPAQYGWGLALKPTRNFVIAFDMQRVLYSEVEAIGNPIENLSRDDGFLGASNGAGFGWNDQTVYKLGMKYTVNSKWDLSIGANYGDSPMPGSQLLFSAVAPAVTEWHASLGIAYRPSPNVEWSFDYVHAFHNTEKGVANSGGQFDQFFPNDTATGPGDMQLEMRQDSLGLTFSYKL